MALLRRIRELLAADQGRRMAADPCSRVRARDMFARLRGR
jgi:hypothetical protein